VETGQWKSLWNSLVCVIAHADSRYKGWDSIPEVVHIGFVVDETVLGQTFLRLLWFSHASYQSVTALLLFVQ
jgi:hypothetical protein